MKHALSILLSIACAGAPQHASVSPSKQQRRVDPSRACHLASDCLVLPRTCCGQCGAATPADSIALSRQWNQAHPYQCTGGSGCPDCFTEPDSSLVPICRAGTCEALFVSASPLSRCTANDQCVVRAAQCCECGARQWLAVRRDRRDDLSSLMCSGTSCPACVGNPPANRIPVCEHGHCVVSSIGSDDQ
jgi:hypothetical protein